MSFEPDIVVMEPEAPAPSLVVEVKLDEERLRPSIDGVRSYMRGARCPVGLLVAPTKIIILRESYTGPGPDSIHVVGEFELASVFPTPAGETTAERGMAFEAVVQAWLERLRSGEGWHDLDPLLAASLREHVLPVLQGGIRAASPRARRWQTQ